ncbi:DUF1329 domain-containing protein [Aromatoleum toluclasticum]|uniref:DUF1329 domain-containing protein n=1 Tax=Aromatoleum toluclasticum TaxID=92003 RepID=UPI0003746313|nr:DUF1329 domain-containing protein [Aromatoleum toluclasticum]
MIRSMWMAVTAAALLAGSQLAGAAVSADEAGKLKTTFTPLGAERAANKDGSIPVWDGKGVGTVAGAKLGDIPTDLFAAEKPSLQITAANMAQHLDKLSEGTQALLKKYPDTFRVEVYPTHRTAAAPQAVYDAVFRNASQCRIKDDGGLEGCFGGTPFPIPKDGREALMNHLMRLMPESTEHGFNNVVVNADGSRTIASRADYFNQYPHMAKDGSAEKWSGEYFLGRLQQTAPPFKAGEALALRDSTDAKSPRTVWQYLVGQRRVRRAPTVCCDTPDFVASGANYFDEVEGLSPPIDRHEWKLVGKAEMYVPYNNNRFYGASLDDAFSGHHLNSGKLRWELHRVWIVEGNVAAGKRHAVPKRRYYLDEDTWLILMSDGFDANGKLWRTAQGIAFALPSLPSVIRKTDAVYNLQANSLSVVQLLNGEYFRVVAPKPDAYFTGDAIAADAAR